MKHIVLAGSMKFYEQMQSWKHKLEQQGFKVTIPPKEDLTTIEPEKFEAMKRSLTNDYFDDIESAHILLVLNYDDKDKKNYIGGNTFANIAYAVALNYRHGKNIDIRTVNPLPTDVPYATELRVWEIQEWDDDLADSSYESQEPRVDTGF